MNAPAQTHAADARLMQAAEWLLRLNSSDVDEDVTAQWLDWCQSDPDNFAAFERMRSVWQKFNDPRFGDPAAPSRGSASLRLALAATVVLAMGTAVWFAASEQRPVLYTQALRTNVASLESRTLPDGSRVELGARTAVRVRLAEDRRTVFVDDGEAFFNVAEDPGRPFVVQAGDLQVVAVGTAFNVRKSSGRVVVTVTEGVVRVASMDAATGVAGSGAPFDLSSESAGGQVRAGPGVQVTYIAERRTLTLAKVKSAVAAPWRSGRLEFVDEPLGSVIADLNRYSHRRISLQDGRLATLVFTGTVRSDAIDDWLTALEKVFPVDVVDRGADGILLAERADPSTTH